MAAAPPPAPPLTRADVALAEALGEVRNAAVETLGRILANEFQVRILANQFQVRILANEFRVLAASSQTSFVVGAIAAEGVALFVDGSSAHFLADLNLDLREALFGSSKALDFWRLDRGRGHDADREHCSRSVSLTPEIVDNIHNQFAPDGARAGSVATRWGRGDTWRASVSPLPAAADLLDPCTSFRARPARNPRGCRSRSLCIVQRGEGIWDRRYRHLGSTLLPSGIDVIAIWDPHYRHPGSGIDGSSLSELVARR